MNRGLACAGIALAGVFVWSGIAPHDQFTWLLEVFPAILGAAYLGVTWKRFQLTPFVLVLIAAHMAILMVGGHYTYARVPLFDWLRDTFHLDRNYYDRVGHFAQGFVPAMVAREVLLRRSPLQRGRLLFFLCLSICMAITAWYELLEFAVARMTGSAADDFLGTQGDPWDTQWDMTFCFIGALCSLAFLPRLHDRWLRRLV